MPTIAVLGGECSGKTTLAADLGAALDARVIPEALRAFVDTHGRTPTQAEQAPIMAAQRAAIQAAQAPGQWVISDPAPAMTAIYSQLYFADDSLWEQARADLSATDYVFWCDIDLPWTADGLHRDGPHMRRAAHRAIADLVAGVRTASDQPVWEVSGPRSQRTDLALRMIRD
jgi:nicotinamide riboside kinase